MWCFRGPITACTTENDVIVVMNCFQRIWVIDICAAFLTGFQEILNSFLGRRAGEQLKALVPRQGRVKQEAFCRDGYIELLTERLVIRHTDLLGISIAPGLVSRAPNSAPQVMIPGLRSWDISTRNLTR